MDTNLGVAIVRSLEGEMHAWRVGDVSRDGAWRLQRLYQDRIEVAAAKDAAGSRYWLEAGRSGAIAVTRQDPEGDPRLFSETLPRAGGVTR